MSTTTLIWPKRSKLADYEGGLRIRHGEIVEVDDDDRVEQLLNRGFAHATDEDIAAAAEETDPDGVADVIDRIQQELPHYHAPQSSTPEFVVLR